ncbi:MAG TPA: hypothetical protein VF659_15415 [Pyrinomonadaceae bacterium]|jgi:uncharacterized membrane protein YGL010W
MRTPHSYRRHRARCTATRSLRSAALALSIVTLPRVASFIEHGTFTHAALRELLQSLCVAALMVMFNYIQRLRADDERGPGAARARRRRRRQQEEGHPSREP